MGIYRKYSELKVNSQHVGMWNEYAVTAFDSQHGGCIYRDFITTIMSWIYAISIMKRN
jgi:hypothetical protein